MLRFLLFRPDASDRSRHKLYVVNVDRRLFLFALAVPLYPAAELQTFSGEEAVLVDDLCDQIIPADDAVGAKAAGVLYYLDRQLSGPLKRFAANYHSGLALLAERCRKQTGRPFEQLPFGERTAFLAKVETGDAPEPAGFFKLFIDHTMQGFYGSPVHGGNRNEASWKMLDIQQGMEGHRS